MKKLVVGILGLLLFVSVALNLMFLRSLQEKTASSASFSAANHTLASHLFFASLADKNVDVFCPPPAIATNFQVTTYNIRLRPIEGAPTDYDEGIDGFLEHNHYCVYLLACREFERDPETAVAFLRLVADVEPHAEELLALVRDKGREQPDVVAKTEDGAPAEELVALMEKKGGDHPDVLAHARGGARIFEEYSRIFGPK